MGASGRNHTLTHFWIISGFCKDLLEVADVLQKAVEAAKLEDKNLGSSLSGGIELTQTQMHQVFSRHGLTHITPAVGETKFDPNIHEALFQIPVPDKGKQKHWFYIVPGIFAMKKIL